MSLETPSPDPLNIGELVKEEKPLKAIDFCYHDENEMVDVLDCISLCVMVIAYAPDSIRGQQMLVRCPHNIANNTLITYTLYTSVIYIILFIDNIGSNITMLRSANTITLVQ